MLPRTTLRALFPLTFFLFSFSSKSQNSAWIFGNLYFGAQQVRTAQTLQHAGSTYPEISKTAPLLNGEITFDYYLPQWSFSSGIGYSKTTFSYTNYAPGGTNRRRTKQTLDTSSPYLVFIPRYRASEVFSAGPRMELRYGSQSFHSESEINEGNLLAYVGIDTSFEYNLGDMLFRTGMIGCVDLNESKRTVIYAAIYLGIAWNLFSNEAPNKVSLEKRPIIKASTGEVRARNYDSNSLSRPTIKGGPNRTITIKIPSIDFLFSSIPSTEEKVLPTGLRYLNEVSTNLSQFERSWSEARITGVNHKLGNLSELNQQALVWAEQVRSTLAKAKVPTFKTSASSKIQAGSERFVEIKVKAISEEGYLTLLGVFSGVQRKMGYR